MAKSREPMIGKESRPSAIDYETPLSELRVKDLVGVIKGEIEIIKPETSKPEWYKPEGYKPEGYKPEGYKPEWYKPEQIKPERLKPELTKPEKEVQFPEEMVEQIVHRVIEVLKGQKVIK